VRDCALRQIFVQEHCGAADLAAGDIESAELAGDLDDFGSGSTWDVHFGDGQFEGAFAPSAAED
jgi:hypothetical protein